MVTDSHGILTELRNPFFQLFNAHWVSDVRQAEMHTAEQLVPELSAFQVEVAIEKLKRHKSPGIVQIPAELVRSEIHKLLNSTWNKEELP